MQYRVIIRGNRGHIVSSLSGLKSPYLAVCRAAEGIVRDDAEQGFVHWRGKGIRGKARIWFLEKGEVRYDEEGLMALEALPGKGEKR